MHTVTEHKVCRSRGRIVKSHNDLDEKYESMNSLIAWNISKVLETNPNIDLKAEIASIQELLETRSWDVSRVVSNCPEDRYLAGALLAWQQLGHGDASSLYQFIQSRLSTTGETEAESLIRQNIYIVSTSDLSCKSKIFIEHSESLYSDSSVFQDLGAGSNFGPVLKLPMDAKVVMRCEHGSKQRSPTIRCEKKTQHGGGAEKKSHHSCPIMSSCQKRLAEMDSTTAALKKRVDRLTKRETDRIRVIKRAEAAWNDLEQCYISRISGAQEKEEDIMNKIKNGINERSNYKQACMQLAKQLEERLDTAGKEREVLKKIEVDVCERVRRKLRQSDAVATAEATLAQEQTRLAQYERDLRSKEEQMQRKLANLQNEVELSRSLRYEAERALRAELGALKDQVAKVSKRLLTEETDTKKLETEIEQLRHTKSKFIEDLDACKLVCDNRLEGKMTELRMKTEKLSLIKQEVLDCRCKQPQDNSTEAKRTPSLAAICRCTSEDKIQGSCSCKSLRSTLLSNLLRDLFEGLQSELNDTGSLMPCELLKCLEDSHNWDRTSEVKTNLRNFFAKLLVGELDIAIASAIEKYHARWVGELCADKKDQIDSDLNECQQRALENRAQELAEQLAEKLYQERAEQLIKTAKNIVKESQPPCDCYSRPAAAYSCIIKANEDRPQRDSKIRNKANPTLKENPGKNLRNQTAFQKPKIFKKGKVKPVKERINKLASPVAILDKRGLVAKQILNHRAVCTDKYEATSQFLINHSKKKYIDHGTRIDTFRNHNLNQNVSDNCYLKGFNRLDHSYAVNLCLYEPHKHKNLGNALPNNSIETNCILDKEEIKHRRLNSSFFMEDVPSVELANSVLQPFVVWNENSRENNTLTCSNTCLCFNKLASNHSLDNILENFREKKTVYSTPLNEKRNDRTLSNKDRIRTSYHFDSFDKYFTDENERNATSYVLENFNRESTYKSDLNYNNNVGFDAKLTPKGVQVGTAYDNTKEYKQNNIYPQKKNVQRPICDQCNKYTNIERNLCDMKTSVPNFYEQQNSDSLNVIKNSVVDTSKDSLNFDCRVDFLGVSLHDSENKNKNNENKNKFTNKPSRQERTEDVLQIICDDKMRDKYLNIVESKFNKQSNERSVSNNFNQNYDENMTFLNTNNDCVCCTNDEDTCELEVNTFSLLTEYLQKKLEEHKMFTCRSSDISPLEAKLLFNQIIEKIKKMILESSKELSYCCFDCNKSDGLDACWRRACGLLQEYLRIKMKRLKCSYSIENDNLVSRSLPKVLDKICNMIENDFERLKNISKDLNSLKCYKTRSSAKQLSDTKYNSTILFKINEDSNVYSNKNSFTLPPPTILINSQSLNMTNSEGNEEKNIIPNVESAGKCYSFHSINSENDAKITNSLENALNWYSAKKFDIDDMFISVLKKEEENNARYPKTQSMSAQCISNNVNCACNSISSRYPCTKDELKENKILIDANTSPTISIQNTMKTDLRKPIAFGYNMQEENKKLEKQIETLADTEIVELKESDWDFQKGANNSTNTHRQFYDNIDYFSYDEWDDCESVPFHENSNYVTSNKTNFYDSVLLPLEKPENSKNETLLCTSDDNNICSIRSHDCECEMVPICHVKMLMDNIERKLLNDKCTCDSLHPSVCPAHSESV